MAQCLIALVTITIAALSSIITFSAAKPEGPLNPLTSKERRELRQTDRTFDKCILDRPGGEDKMETKIPMTQAYCTCLYQAREGDKDTLPSKFPTGDKEIFCRLHAMLSVKPSQIALAAAKSSQKPVGEPKNFAAEGHQDVDIQNELIVEEIVFSGTQLTWKKNDRQLVFEGLKDVKFATADMTYVAALNDVKEKATMFFNTPQASAFKFTTKVKSRTLKADIIDAKDASNTCDLTIDNLFTKFSKFQTKSTANDDDRVKVLMPAFGGKKTVEAALIMSICEHFKSALNLALEDMKQKSGKKLTDLPDYGL